MKNGKKSSSALLIAAAAQAASRGGSATPRNKPNLIAAIAGFILAFRRRELLETANRSEGHVPSGGFASTKSTRRGLPAAASTGGTRHG